MMILNLREIRLKTTNHEKILGKKFLVGPRFFNKRNTPLHTSEKNENFFLLTYIKH